MNISALMRYGNPLRLRLFWLFLAGLALLLLGGCRDGFTGSRVKNPDVYWLDVEKMNGTDRHTLELQEGDTLLIHIKTEKGALYMEIQTPDGTAIYRGNGKETTDFTVAIPESGVYTVVVEARRAKGAVHVQRKEETAWNRATNGIQPILLPHCA